MARKTPSFRHVVSRNLLLLSNFSTIPCVVRGCIGCVEEQSASITHDALRKLNTSYGLLVCTEFFRNHSRVFLLRLNSTDSQLIFRKITRGLKLNQHRNKYWFLLLNYGAKLKFRCLLLQIVKKRLKK